MRVQDIMSSPLFTCQSNQSLYVVAQMMWDHDCGAIPIVDDRGKLVGMVTDRDVCMAAFTQGRALQELPIHIAMSRHLYSVSPEQDATEVMQLMAAKQVRRIPVVGANGHPVGIVSINDLTRDAATAPKISETLGKICTPHEDAKRAA